jgi:DNA-binding beta-propeller fold protein YncE
MSVRSRESAGSAVSRRHRLPHHRLPLRVAAAVGALVTLCIAGVTGPALAATPTSTAVASLRTLPVGLAPSSVAVDNTAHDAFVANALSGSVSMVNTSTGQLVRTIHLAGAPVDVAVDPAADRLLVTESAGTVVVLGERSDQVLQTLALPGANQVAVDPQLHLAYVTAQNSGYLTVLDDVTGTVVSTLDLRASGFALAVDPAAGDVFVTGGRVRCVMVVSEKSRRVVARVALPVAPYDIAADPVSGQVWVTAPTAGMVVDISATSRHIVHVRHTGPGSFPEGVAIDSGSNTAYITNADAGTVETFNDLTAQHDQTLVATGRPVAVGVDSVNHLSVVARTETDALSEFAPSSNGTSADTSPQVAAATAQPAGPVSRKPIVPSDGVLVGAHVFVEKGVSEADQEATFESEIGRKLAVDNSYINWDENLIGGLQIADGRNGRIPMLSWHCDLDGDGAIIDGSADNLIRAQALEVAQYGHPVFIRWAWEMNLVGGQHAQCLGGLGAAGYIRAWQHIWTIFQQEGATNASFVWVPSGWNAGADADQYYPGARFVDWVGADGYARQDGGPSFAQTFTYFYSQWAGNKPIMITETGVEGTPREQAHFLAAMFATLPRKFPDIKSVVYFDSTSEYLLTSRVAQAAFAAGGALPYFSAREASSLPAITTSAPPGATVSAPYAGRVSATGFPVPLISVTGLPAGLHFRNDGEGTGLIAGTPTEFGSFTITETALNQQGSRSHSYTLTVATAPS